MSKIKGVLNLDFDHMHCGPLMMSQRKGTLQLLGDNLSWKDPSKSANRYLGGLSR